MIHQCGQCACSVVLICTTTTFANMASFLQLYFSAKEPHPSSKNSPPSHPRPNVLFLKEIFLPFFVSSRLAWSWLSTPKREREDVPVDSSKSFRCWIIKTEMLYSHSQGFPENKEQQHLLLNIFEVFSPSVQFKKELSFFSSGRHKNFTFLQTASGWSNRAVIVRQISPSLFSFFY